MTNVETDDRYGSVNIADSGMLHLAAVKLSATITLQTQR